MNAGDSGAGDPLLPEDTRIGEFRIRGLLGEGAMGQVYLAQDTTLGRRVALKLIKRSAMQADALARFLEEARATASFNHPNIVTLHAVGEHDGRPYLALEYLDGESLRARLAGGVLPVREALRHGRAVAEAIAEAHRRGLVHADLKPENIVIPRDGRVRVVDFGLAKLAGDAPGGASGTPAYMAPERWRGDPPAGAIDIWAFGITLHELVTGRRPFTDAALQRLAFARALAPPDLPAAPWAPLVRDCLAFDPAARPNADDLVRRLAALLDPRAAASEADDARCPFPGLAAFSRDDAADYFGRRTELDAIIEQLRARALIPIVGPSGIGKSSFVRAAVLPRLDETGRWIAVTLRPGGSPFEGLAAALALPDRPAGDLAASLRRHPDALSLALADFARHHGARVLVVLDQFEEAFTLAPEPDAIAFCDGVARAAVPAEPWRIVLTLRDDFLGRLAAAPAMRPHLGAVMPLAPLSATDLRAAVLGPLASAGYEADTPDLVARLVRDVDGQPACLPLLQFTCRSLWERRDPAARRVLAAEYDAMGGATGALATHAQRFLAELTSEQVRLARSILLALVNPDGTRRPRLRAELLDGLPAGGGDVADQLIDRLLERRLVVAARDVELDAATLELAHEALAAAWPQLARWLDETYEQRVLVADLEQASLLWQRRGQRDDETWAGVALGEAVRKVDEWHVPLPSISRAFLDASVRRDRRLRRRRRWLIGAIIGVLGAATAVAVTAAVAFARKEDEARASEEAARASETRLRASQREQQLAAADMGRFQLELEPFDWDSKEQRARRPEAPPAFTWRLRAPDPDDPRRPHRVYDDEVRRHGGRWQDGVLTELVEIRSGAAFLEVSGRGGDCAASRVFLQHVPGYRERAEPPARIRIRIPTCQATLGDLRDVPAGEFYESVIDHDGAPAVDRLATLPAFAIDRTEVTRGAFAVYGQLEHLTGDAAAPSKYLKTDPGEEAWLPMAGVTYFTAASYCAFVGKELPTIREWQKAFRGGTHVNGAENRAPTRATPWISKTARRPANTKPANGRGAPARVGSYPEDRSEYGIVDLAGNVGEWSASPSHLEDLRYVLGGAWTVPAELHPEQIGWQNSRPDLDLAYDVGFRCVSRTNRSRID